MSELQPLSADTTRVMRHLVATIAYRASRAIRGAPPAFESVRLAEGGMSARELILHMSNVTAFAYATVNHTEREKNEPRDWHGEVDRFYGLLARLDARLAAGASLEPGMDLRLVQGPLSDALTHVGQLMTMRRQAGAAVPGANFIIADVRTGRIALDEQAD